MSEPVSPSWIMNDDLAGARARVVGRGSEPLDDRVDRALQEEERAGDERGDHDEADEAAPCAPRRFGFSGSWSVVRRMPRRDARPARASPGASSSGSTTATRRCSASRASASPRLASGHRLARTTRCGARARARPRQWPHGSAFAVAGSPARSACQSTASRSAADRAGLRWELGHRGDDPSSVVSRRPGCDARCPLRVDGVLQNDNGCNLVDDGTLASTRLPRGAKRLLGAHRREPLVDESHGRARRVASRAAKAIASSVDAVAAPESESGLPTTSSIDVVLLGELQDAARRPRRRRPLACTVSTGTASSPPASQRATPMRARPTSMPSLAPGRIGLTGRARRAPRRGRAGIARHVAAAALREVGLAAAAAAEDAGHRLRERARVRSRVARGRRGRDDRERACRRRSPPGRRRMPRRRAARARRSRASAARRPKPSVPTVSATSSTSPVRTRVRRQRGNAVVERLRLELGDALLRGLEVRDELADPVDELLGPGLQVRASARRRAPARPRTAGRRRCRRATRRAGWMRRPTTRRRC